VHLKNYARGKTTNERFARRAQSSFSEMGSESLTNTNMDKSGAGDTESLGGSQIDEEEGGDGKAGRSSKKSARKNSSSRRTRSCL
jgi:hypothetical protein